MNIGIVGAGNMGSMHARILNALPDCALIGITAHTAKRSAQIAKDLTIRRFESLRELIDDPSIDVVDICSPTRFHAENAIECMKGGKHVIIEYPICRTKKELNQLRKVSKKTGKICAVAYYSRYQSQYKVFFELAKTDAIGDITTLHISRRSPKVFSSDDIINNLMAQDIDCMVSLLGKPKSFTVANNGKDSCAILFTYDSCTVTIEGLTNMHDKYPFTTNHFVSGTRGSLELDWSFIDAPKSQMKHSNERGITILENADYDPYQYELEYIINRIGNNDGKGIDIESVYDATLLSFRCRDTLR